MEALLLALFAVGLGLGLIIRAMRPAKPVRRPRYRAKDSLDSVDEMVLWGEVTGDDFYRM